MLGTLGLFSSGGALGQGEMTRPEGPLVWIHIGAEAEALGLPELIDRLREDCGDVGVLITLTERSADNPLDHRLPEGVITQTAPKNPGTGVAAFFQTWRPDVCVWADNRLDPALLNAARKAKIPMFLIDARVPERPGWRWLPGIRRALLRGFDFVLAGDERAAEGLRGLGVSGEKIEVTGFLQEGGAPLPCIMSERDSLAILLAARPVWLAAGACAGEVDTIVEAHRQAMRRAHRLLLVIVPEPLSDGEALAERLEAEGWVVGLRSRDDDPEPETEVFVADMPDEMGLWYRLSPLTFMGGTLTTDKSACPRNPYEAAALGSAVLYGPVQSCWRESFERLRDAGAARPIGEGASLARAVEQLLAPDKVAEMAAAAWEVTTSGAEATDRAVALIAEALDRGEG